jgi:hypothetical protein
MPPRVFGEIWRLALNGTPATFDDHVERRCLNFLGRTFEQELHRLASLDVAEATF